MPLILITGYPTSGKTHRAQQIVDYFQQRISSTPSRAQLRIHHISDTSLSIPRRVYDLESKSANERSNNASEKDARARVYAEVKRLLGPDDVVVCDAAGGNYIKGWRYQLYCEAKAVRTPSCVVHIGTPIARAREINAARLKRHGDSRAQDGDGDGDDDGCEPEHSAEDVRDLDADDEEPYAPSAWENLVYRFEEPNGMARWDSPLFTTLWDDASPPCAAIWDALVGPVDGAAKVVVKPNQATVLKPSSAEDYLYELDRATQEVLGRISEWTKDHLGELGGEVVLDDEGLVVVELPPGRAVGLPALQRLRRQFISMNRQNAVSAARIKESFVGYLNDSFQAA